MRRTQHRSSIARALGAVPAAVLMCAAWMPAHAQDQAQGDTSAPAGGLQEITVTATRREESLSKVPISVTALSQENLDLRGIKDFSEVARFTPGVAFDNSGTNNISIRGISGTGGAGTTGIYIDDTPIQMRALAFSPDEALPKSFDIDRVEVLRGPQGTLFGSGSEGGTVRYITTQPSLSRTSVLQPRRGVDHRGWRPQLRGGRRRRRPDRAGQVRRTPHGLVPARRRLDRRMDPYTLPDRTTRTPTTRRPSWCGWPACGRPTTNGRFTPSIYYQSRQRHDISNYWPTLLRPQQQPFRQRRPEPAQSARQVLPAGAQDRG